MQNYSQKNEKWKNKKIGKTNLTLGEIGCFVTALAIMDGRTPDVILDLLNEGNAFNDNGLLFPDVAAKILRFSYCGETHNQQKVGMPCIAETNYYVDKGVPQHFFVWLGDGLIIDPIDGQTKGNCYPIVTFRLFAKKEEVKKAEPKKIEPLINPPDFGKCLEDKEPRNKPITAKTLEQSFTFWEHIKVWLERFRDSLFHKYFEKRGWN